LLRCTITGSELDELQHELTAVPLQHSLSRAELTCVWLALLTALCLWSETLFPDLATDELLCVVLPVLALPRTPALTLPSAFTPVVFAWGFCVCELD
jgi:hypothetical protein